MVYVIIRMVEQNVCFHLNEYDIFYLYLLWFADRHRNFLSLWKTDSSCIITRRIWYQKHALLITNIPEESVSRGFQFRWTFRLFECFIDLIKGYRKIFQLHIRETHSSYEKITWKRIFVIWTYTINNKNKSKWYVLLSVSRWNLCLKRIFC